MVDAAAAVVAEVAGWAAELGALHRRMGRHVKRVEARRRRVADLRGRLSPVAGTTGWQVAEPAGAATPDGRPRLLAVARWDADAVRAAVRAAVGARLGDPPAVLVVEATGCRLSADGHHVGGGAAPGPRHGRPTRDLPDRRGPPLRQPPWPHRPGPRTLPPWTAHATGRRTGRRTRCGGRRRACPRRSRSRRSRTWRRRCGHGRWMAGCRRGG